MLKNNRPLLELCFEKKILISKLYANEKGVTIFPLVTP